ncbi:hypothetical protein [Flavobacterium sp. 3HN19-14]|uniref:hypothetical protein n=1 Tax=Flavobacterium sp. 3HN19-14 TaxID=3448133 RepID=UPI003EE14273
MKITPKFGIDQLVFGMQQENVTAIYGMPDKIYKDEEENLVALYNSKKLRLTFYMEEGFRLGYLIGSNDNLEIFGQKIIGMEIGKAKAMLIENGLKKWTLEAFDSYENYFNEDNWIILQTEFGEVTKFEIGAIINDKDEFDWKFKK